MKGWIIYNGSAKIDKIRNLVRRVCAVARDHNMALEMVANNELVIYYDRETVPGMYNFRGLSMPDYVIFWDKDVLLARHLELMGIRLFNSREAIESCDDKALMTMKLSGAGLPIPKTIVSPFVYENQEKLSAEYLEGFVQQDIQPPFILKETKGSFGMQVYKLDTIDELREKIMSLGYRRFIIQEYIGNSAGETAGEDIRVNVIGDRVVGAMLRQNNHDFRANITLGGTGFPFDLNEEQKDIALAANKALGLDFSGVDLLINEAGETILCEVNSNVNFVSFERVTGIDFATQLLEYVRAQV